MNKEIKQILDKATPYLFGDDTWILENLHNDINYNLIKEFNNIYEAYKETNKNMTHIKDCCNGKRKMAGNYIWKYI